MTRVDSWEEHVPEPVAPALGLPGTPGEPKPDQPKPEQLAAAFSKLTDAQLLDLAVKMAEPEMVQR